MSQATGLNHIQRIDNYINQDMSIHRGIAKNCPTYMTPKQRRRQQQKLNRAQRIALTKLGLSGPAPF